MLVYLLRAWFAGHRDDAGWGRALFDPTVGTALSLIHADPGRAWTLDTLARATGVPPATLTRRFAALTGQSPMAYLAAWHMSLAARGLRDGDATVRQIARELGYDSEFAFARAFKRATGSVVVPHVIWRMCPHPPAGDADPDAGKDVDERSHPMRYRTLGRTGIQVSPYALGAMMFGAIGNPDHDESIRIIHKALDAGINVVDTAEVYSDGESEEIVGKALKGRRDTVVLATKMRPRALVATADRAEDPNQRGNSRRAIMTAVENSLRRLQTDYIDLYQIHRPDPDTDIEETLSALSDLIHSGKVRVAGSSSMPASDIVEAQWVAERRGLERFRSEQPTYSILNRGIEAETLPVAQRHGMGVVVWSPLAQGLLTGRVRRGQQTDLRRTAIFSHMRDERRLDAVEKIIPLADEAGLPMTHLAMAFAIAHPGVTSAIIGPRTMGQLDDLLASVGVALSDDILDRIDEIVPPGTDIGTLDMAYRPPALQQPGLRRRPAGERSAA